MGGAFALLFNHSRASARYLTEEPGPPSGQREERELSNESEIERLIGAGQSAQALPLVKQNALVDPDNESHWQLLLKLAGWNSNAEAAIDALKNLVRLNGSDRDLRLALAQRLLWVPNTAEALPHAKWLVARPEETEPVALEVASWILLGEKDLEAARKSVARWIKAEPTSASARWVLADLSHWSVHWRDAAQQYKLLRVQDEHAQKSAVRQRMLAKDHPTETEARATYWRDTTGVEYSSLGTHSRVQMPGRLVASADAEVGQWEGRNEKSIAVARGLASLRFEWLDAIQPELVAGMEGDSEENSAPVLLAKGHISLFGRLFGRMEAGWDRYRMGLVAAREDVRVQYLRALTYYEPHRWIFLGVDASANWLSDDNRRLYGVLALGLHNPGNFQLEPRAFAQAEYWQQARGGAIPYFTTQDPIATGADLTVRYTRPQWWMRAEATAGFVHQGGLWAFTPRGSIAVDLADHWIGKITAGYVGAVVYRQFRVDASFGYRF